MNRVIRQRSLLGILLLAALLAVAGCAITKQARTVERSGFLGADGGRLRETDDPAKPKLFFLDERADWRSYDSVFIYPVTLWASAEESFGEVKDRQRLAQNFHGILQTEIGKDYKVLHTLDSMGNAGHKTMVLRVAVTEADKPTPVLDTATTVIPQTRLLMTAGGYVTGKPAFTGEIQVEFKLNSFVSGALLAAGVDKRVGEKRLSKAFNSWAEVDAATAFWAQQARYWLCRMRGDTNCVAPKAKKGI